MTTAALDLDQVQVTGPLDARLRRGLDHLLSARERILAFSGWGGDQYGRWLPAVALTQRCLRAQEGDLGEVLRRFLRTQGLDGMFGEAQQPMCLWWGAGRALIGLLEYWQLGGSPEALAAAVRLGDHYLAAFPFEEVRKPDQPGATHYQSGIEGLVALSRVAADRRYLDLAGRIFQTLDPEFGTPEGGEHCHHTHGYLSTLRGVLDLYETTGEEACLGFVSRVWDHVLAHQMWVTGGIGEMSTNPFEHRDETCPVADWFRLSLRLWRLTRRPLCMDVAEHCLFNHLYFGQDPCGGFCQYRSLQDESTGVFRDSLAWYCCSMHGQRALLEAVRHIYTCDEAGIDVNLLCDSTARIRLPGGRTVRLEQRSRLPHRVHLVVVPEGEARFDLRLRRPRWSATCRLQLNGRDLPETADGAGLSRTWRPGDTVDLHLTPVFRVIPEGANGFASVEAASREAHGPVRRAALQYGPFVLMVDRVLNDHLAGCPRFEIALPVKPGGEPALPGAADDPPPGGLCLAGTRLAVVGREWTPGSPGLDRGAALKRMTLVPVAEMTEREGRPTDPFSMDIGPAEGRMTGLYKVRHDIWWTPAVVV